MQCSICGVGGKLRRCSNCGKLYCSKRCQRIDWRGGHSSECGVRPLSEEKKAPFLAWVSGIVDKPVRDVKYGMLPGVFEAIEGRRDPFHVVVPIREFLLLLLDGDKLSIDCALGIVTLKMFLGGAGKNATTNFPWPVCVDWDSGAVAVSTTLAMDEDSPLRSGSTATPCAVQWVIPVGTEWWAMTHDGLCSGTLGAFLKTVERLHTRLAESPEEAERVLRETQYGDGAGDVDSDFFIGLHADLLYHVAKDAPSIRGTVLHHESKTACERVAAGTITRALTTYP